MEPYTTPNNSSLTLDDLLSEAKGRDLVLLSRDINTYFNLDGSNSSADISPESQKFISLLEKETMKGVTNFISRIVEKHSLARDDIKSQGSSNNSSSTGTQEASVFKLVLKNLILPSDEKEQKDMKMNAMKLVKGLLSHLTIQEIKKIVDGAIAGNEQILKEGLNQAQADEIINTFKKENITLTPVAG